jgi:hypothetical protein
MTSNSFPLLVLDWTATLASLLLMGVGAWYTNEYLFLLGGVLLLLTLLSVATCRHLFRTSASSLPLQSKEEQQTDKMIEAALDELPSWTNPHMSSRHHYQRCVELEREVSNMLH